MAFPIHFHIVHAFESFEAGQYRVEAIRADHTPGEECLFYRVSRDGQSLLYAHDTGWFPEDTVKQKSEGGNCLLAYSTNNEQGFTMETYGNLRRSIIDFDGLQLIKIQS